MEDNKLYAMTKEELEQYLATIPATIDADGNESELVKKIKDRLEFMSKIDECKPAEVGIGEYPSDKIDNAIESVE